MNVDDITFSRFVNNGLSHGEMTEVEKSLINAGEINASLQACILNYEINVVKAEEMLGADVENPEQISSAEDRNDMSTVSKEEKQQILSTAIMDYKFSKKELQTIKRLTDLIKESMNSETSFEDNLTQFYLSQCSGTFPEEAHEIVSGIRHGIDIFNANLQQAMSEAGFDYVSELKKISSEMTISEKYELYVNFLAALQTLNMNNLSSEQMSQIEEFQTIRERLVVNGDVSEEMLADVERQIAAMLQNNMFCMGSVESLKDLISELPNGMEAIERIITGSERDVREKLIASVATYAAYRNEQLESLAGKDISPEEIAIAISAGMEEMRVMNDLKAGRTTVDKVIKVLKIIGGVALFSLLAYMALIGIAAIGTMTATLASFIFGASAVATIGALIAGVLVIWPLTQSAVNVGGRVMEWSSRAFDAVVDTGRETAWPAVRNGLESVWNWFASLFRNGTVIRQEQKNDLQTAQTI